MLKTGRVYEKTMEGTGVLKREHKQLVHHSSSMAN